MDNPSEKAHSIAVIMLECKTVNELDQLTAEFNHMLPVLRSHVERIEELNSKGGFYGAQHPDGYVVYTWEAKK